MAADGGGGHGRLAHELRFRPEERKLEALGDVGEHRAQMVDLGVGVGRGELDPEADLVLGHQRVGGHRHVDAAVEQHVADLVDAVGDRRAGPR